MTTRACPFASKSVAEHVGRGVGAAMLIALAIWLVHGPGTLATAGAIFAVAGAVVLMRGCPTCWLFGLFATLGAGSSTRAGQADLTPAAGSVSRPASVPAPR